MKIRLARLHPVRRGALVTAALAVATTDAAASAARPILDNPVAIGVYLLLALAVGAYLVVPGRRLVKSGRRYAAARSNRQAMLAERKVLEAERLNQIARMRTMDQALADTQRRVALIQQLTAFLREAPRMESPEVGLPKIDAFRRTTSQAEALLGATANELFKDAADKAFELFVQRGRIAQGHEGRAISPRAGMHGSVADILQWFAANAATAEDELAPLILSRSGLKQPG